MSCGTISGHENSFGVSFTPVVDVETLGVYTTTICQFVRICFYVARIFDVHRWLYKLLFRSTSSIKDNETFNLGQFRMNLQIKQFIGCTAFFMKKQENWKQINKLVLDWWIFNMLLKFYVPWWYNRTIVIVLTAHSLGYFHFILNLIDYR